MIKRKEFFYFANRSEQSFYFTYEEGGSFHLLRLIVLTVAVMR